MGTFKINVDASVKEGHHDFAVGMVLRDDQGAFIAGKTMRFAGKVQVMEAEMIGIAEALSWLDFLPQAKYVIESDSQQSVAAINGVFSNIKEIGILVHHCESMIAERTGISVIFAQKTSEQGST